MQVPKAGQWAIRTQGVTRNRRTQAPKATPQLPTYSRCWPLPPRARARPDPRWSLCVVLRPWSFIAYKWQVALRTQFSLCPSGFQSGRFCQVSKEHPVRLQIHPSRDETGPRGRSAGLKESLWGKKRKKLRAENLGRKSQVFPREVSKLRLDTDLCYISGSEEPKIVCDFGPVVCSITFLPGCFLCLPYTSRSKPLMKMLPKEETLAMQARLHRWVPTCSSKRLFSQGSVHLLVLRPITYRRITLDYGDPEEGTIGHQRGSGVLFCLASQS
jgi:hypothetical protein